MTRDGAGPPGAIFWPLDFGRRELNVSAGRFCLALGLLVNSDLCWANESNALEVGVVLSSNRFDYREYDGAGQQLNHERATIPGVALSLGGPLGDFFWLGELTFQKGSARYEGRTSLNTPHSTTTQEKIFDGSIQVGRWFAPSELPATALYVGFGHREWDRDIAATQTVGALFETYSWWYGFLGAKARVVKRDRLEWIVDARVMRPLDPKVLIDFKGAFSASPEVEPTARPGIRIALPLRYRMSDGSVLSLEPYFEQWKLGRSENVSFRSGALTVTVHEPESETRTFGVRFGWHRTF